jgi:hypothetical protein
VFSEKVAQVADLSLVLAVLTVVLWPWLGSNLKSEQDSEDRDFAP